MRPDQNKILVLVDLEKKKNTLTSKHPSVQTLSLLGNISLVLQMLLNHHHLDFPKELMSTLTGQADSQYSVNKFCRTDMKMKAGAMPINFWICYRTEHIVGFQ